MLDGAGWNPLAVAQAAERNMRAERNPFRGETDGLGRPLDPILEKLNCGRRLKTEPEDTGPAEIGKGADLREPQRHGLGTDDIGLWEVNEAFASQAIYCRDKLGIPDEILNVNGGSVLCG